MHEKREDEKTYHVFELDLGRRTCGWGDLRVRKSFGSREIFLSREKWENESWIALQLYIEKCSLMDQYSVENL